MRYLRLAGLLVLSGLLSACSFGLPTTVARHSGANVLPVYELAYQGELTGQNAQLGIVQQRGVELAITNADASTTLGFKLRLVSIDDQGDDSRAKAAAQDIVADPSILGVIGPNLSGTTEVVGGTYSKADLAFITPSATNATLQNLGFRAFHRIVSNDDVEGAQAAQWLGRKAISTLYVVQDESPYGEGVGDTVAETARALGIHVIEQGVNGTTTSNYAPVAAQVVASTAKALFYAGYARQAGEFARALRTAGYAGIAVGGNGIKSSTFVEQAGDAGYNWYMTCGCQDPTIEPQSRTFATEYEAAYNVAPAAYAAEAFDAANVFVTAIAGARLHASATRSTVSAAVNAIHYKGITTDVRFQRNGDLAASSATVNLFQDLRGQIVELGNIAYE